MRRILAKACAPAQAKRRSNPLHPLTCITGWETLMRMRMCAQNQASQACFRYAFSSSATLSKAYMSRKIPRSRGSSERVSSQNCVVFTVLKGSFCGNTGKGYIPSIRRNAKIKDNILQEDIVCMNPSSAGWIVIGKSNNGWVEWKDLKGNPIEIYRDKEKQLIHRLSWSYVKK